MALLIDIESLTPFQTDCCLEEMHKSVSDNGTDDIWLPHPSPLLRRLVEMFTERGLLRLAGFK